MLRFELERKLAGAPRRAAWMALAVLVAGAAVGAPTASAQGTKLPYLHPLFSDNMVLQRNANDAVWGWTTPGARVRVSLEPVPPRVRVASAEARAGADGKWMVHLGPVPAGGPYSLLVRGPQEVTLHNVLFGDVWLCSGQSNMEMGIGNVMNAQQEIAAANYPFIRLYTVPKKIALTPQSIVDAAWQVCTPDTVSKGGWNGFSAAAFFFGRKLFQDLHVPIGLIHSSWGGTVAEAWTSAGALNTMPDFRAGVAQVQQAAHDQLNTAYNYERAMADWYAHGDPGTKGNWQEPTLSAADWKTMNLPQFWEGAGLPDFDGVVWFRREVTVPDAWAGKDLVLHLGAIDDRDTTFVNGKRVGATDGASTPRDYHLPAGTFHAGANVLAVRVLDTGGAGGFGGPADAMKLELPGSTDAPISLTGDWHYQVGASLAQMGGAPVQIGDNPNVPTVLYNGMIAPLEPFAIKGATWYQGESNVGRDMQYRTLLPTMIRDWRAHFDAGPFPFLIVQLASFMAVQDQPVESGWAALREAQRLTALHTPNVGIATAIDIGEANDIHPKNKQEVGRRLALAAEAMTYGQQVEYTGPTFKAMTVEGNTARLTFDHAAGLEAHGGAPLRGFALKGADGHWHWADARVEGNAVVLSAAGVDKPVAVRYAWADNPIANLYNGAGLPALPFSTED